MARFTTLFLGSQSRTVPGREREGGGGAIEGWCHWKRLGQIRRVGLGSPLTASKMSLSFLGFRSAGSAIHVTTHSPYAPKWWPSESRTLFGMIIEVWDDAQHTVLMPQMRFIATLHIVLERYRVIEAICQECPSVRTLDHEKLVNACTNVWTW